MFVRRTVNAVAVTSSLSGEGWGNRYDDDDDDVDDETGTGREV
jgi:hypothetical protein